MRRDPWASDAFDRHFDSEAEKMAKGVFRFFKFGVAAYLFVVGVTMLACVVAGFLVLAHYGII